MRVFACILAIVSFCLPVSPLLSPSPYSCSGGGLFPCEMSSGCNSSPSLPLKRNSVVVSSRISTARFGFTRKTSRNPNSSRRKGGRQVKKPRFSQDAEKKMEGKGGPKTIEELERKMLRRFTNKKKPLKAGSDQGAPQTPRAGAHRTKPWERKDDDRRNFQTTLVPDDDGFIDDGLDNVEEWYDEDDEGFEVFKEGDTGDRKRVAKKEAMKGKLPQEERQEKKKDRGKGKEKKEKEKEKGMKDEAYSAKADGAPSPEGKQKNPPADRVSAEKQKKKKPPTPPLLVDSQGDDLFLTMDVCSREMERATAVAQAAAKPFGFQPAEAAPKTFSDLGVNSADLMAALETLKCPTPLPSQSLAIPLIKQGKDCLISTHTGSGKTLAFVIPLLDNLLADETKPREVGVKAIIVAPGRELSRQIFDVVKSLLDNLQGSAELKVAMVIGGTSYKRTLDKLRKDKPDIVVGTPGRLAELICGQGGGTLKGDLKTSRVKALVLDEFDNLLLSSAHKQSTEAVLEMVKRSREDCQFVLASATARDMRQGQIGRWLKEDHAVAEIGGFGRNMETSKVGAQGSPDAPPHQAGCAKALISPINPMSASTLHGVVKLPHKQLALELLRKIFHTSPSPQQVLVFVNDSHRVQVVVDKLAEKGIIAAGLHGGAGSDKLDRAEVAKKLREGEKCTLHWNDSVNGVNFALSCRDERR